MLNEFLENYKILSNMLGYGLEALCRNSIGKLPKGFQI